MAIVYLGRHGKFIMAIGLQRSAAYLLGGATLAMLLCARQALAVPEGVWSISGRVAIEVFDCAGSLCGKVVWLRNPTLRTPELCGRTIIWGLRPSGDNEWSGGWFFDPENSRTYNVSATLVSANEITAEVYLGVPFLGRTETLLRTSLDRLADHC